MEQSGHLTTSGVRSYEHTTCQQRKEISDILAKAAYSANCKPLSSFNVKCDKCIDPGSSCQPVKSGKENVEEQAFDVLKHFNFEIVDGCTFNFTRTVV